MNSTNVDFVQAEALWERVLTAIRRAIVLGDLQPGAHLKEPLLAERFGVSRLPVREAIARLEREGLVRIEPRRGAFVVGITTRDIDDIYECRLVLESRAMRRAATRVNADGLAGLETALAQMAAAVHAGHAGLVAAADRAFHRMLVDLSGSRAILSSWEPLAPLIETILTIASAPPPDLERAMADHRSIIEALARHDVGAAEVLLPDHLAIGHRLALRGIGEVHRELEHRTIVSDQSPLPLDRLAVRTVRRELVRESSR